jgi:hypothetical protein
MIAVLRDELYLLFEVVPHRRKDVFNGIETGTGTRIETETRTRIDTAKVRNWELVSRLLRLAQCV